MSGVVVKRRGHQERFDERKVYASVYSSCLASHSREKEAEKTAALVTKHIKSWIKKKRTVSSGQIFREVGKLLEKTNKDAAYMYRTHMDIS